MRLSATLLFAFLSASWSFAADKDEDKAKDATVMLLKGIKAKDVEATMKIASTPFLAREGGKTKIIKDEAELKKWVKERLDAIEDSDKIPTEVGKLVPFADLAKKLPDDERKKIEEVLGKGGYVALVGSPKDVPLLILVRLKDGKARVVGIGGK